MRPFITMTIIVLALLALLLVGGCYADSPVRWAPGQPQRQTRQAAADIAGRIDREGTAPSTPATRVLVKSAREAAVDAGYPDEPIDVADLFVAAGASDEAVAAADAAADAISATAHQAAADAARRPSVTDAAGGVLDEIGWWLGALAAIGVPGAAAGVGYVRRGRRLVEARQAYEQQRSSAIAIVRQNDAMMNGPLGQTPVQFGEESLPLADVLKTTVYAGQDDATKALVDQAQAEAKAE